MLLPIRTVRKMCICEGDGNGWKIPSGTILVQPRCTAALLGIATTRYMVEALAGVSACPDQNARADRLPE